MAFPPRMENQPIWFPWKTSFFFRWEEQNSTWFPGPKSVAKLGQNFWRRKAFRELKKNCMNLEDYRIRGPPVGYMDEFSLFYPNWGELSRLFDWAKNISFTTWELLLIVGLLFPKMKNKNMSPRLQDTEIIPNFFMTSHEGFKNHLLPRTLYPKYPDPWKVAILRALPILPLLYIHSNHP